MKSKTFGIVMAMLAVMIFTNCATIIHGSKQEISISSYPTKASVSIDNMEMGTTPVTVELKRNKTHLVQINLNGFLPYETNLVRKVDGWIAGNIIFGGLIGLAVDAITGGMYKLTPEQIQAELQDKKTSAQQLKKDGIFMTVVLQPNSEWEKVGQLTRAN